MFAVIRTGGKQYKVENNRSFRFEKIEGEIGTIVTLNEVLMMKSASGQILTGAPLVEGASVSVEITDQFKDDKVIVFKKKRRQNYRRKKGHRQQLTRVKILSINI